MYWCDRAPPHFHAEYGEDEAMIEIESSEILGGSLPRTATKLVRRLAVANRKALRETGHCAQRFLTSSWTSSSRMADAVDLTSLSSFTARTLVFARLSATWTSSTRLQSTMAR